MKKGNFKRNFISISKLFSTIFLHLYLPFRQQISAVREDDDSTNDENNQQKDERRHMMNSTRLKPTPRTPRYNLLFIFNKLNCCSFSIFESIHWVVVNFIIKFRLNLECIVSSS